MQNTLDRATLDALVLEKTNKERFEEIQKVKGKLVNDLKSEGASEEEIVKQASEALALMAETQEENRGNLGSFDPSTR